MPKSEHFIDNIHSDRVRRVADLASARSRKKIGKFLIEGPQAVREAVIFRPDLIDDIYIDSAADPNADIVTSAREHDLYIHEVSSDVLAHMSKDAQSVVAVGRSEGLIASGVAGADAAIEQGAGVVAACWQVRDPGNEGTVIRTADASGCRAVILVGECVDPLNPKVIRSTAGSLFHIPVCRLSEADFFAWAARHSAPVWAADIHGTAGNPPLDLAQAAFGEGGAGLKLAQETPTVVLFGNEARGLPSSMVAQATATIKIPLFGKAESLNLAMSSAVLLYTLAMSSHVGRM